MPHPDPALMQDPPSLRVAGHFGELMQGRLGDAGPIALISLPCPALWVETGGAAPFPVALNEAQVDVLGDALGLSRTAELPRLSARMPVGGGAGSSTASLVAAARLMGFEGSPENLARACTRAEGASDPLMFDDAERLLFAPREGRVLRALSAPPRFSVVGGFYGPTRRTDPADTLFPDIADLLEHWHADMSVSEMAALATESARRSLELRGPSGDPTAELARELGAEGWIIAHTGNARGLIFEPGMVPNRAAAALTKAGFEHVLNFDAGGAA